MSIFTKIGNAVKKGVKQISLKNIVKIGTPLLSMIPIVGGVAQSVVSNISAAAEAKKQARIAEEQGKVELAAAYAAQAEALAQQAGAQTGQQASSVLKAFAKGTTDELKAQASPAAKEIAGGVVADLADQGILAWLKKHMTLLIVGGVALVGGLFLIFSKSGNQPKSKKFTPTRIFG